LAGLCPRPHWGAYSAPPDLLSGLRGPTSKGGREGREGKGKGRQIKEGKVEGGVGRGEGCPGFAFEIYGHLTQIINRWQKYINRRAQKGQNILWMNRFVDWVKGS